MEIRRDFRRLSLKDSVLNFDEKNRDLKILGGGKTPVFPPPRKNILTAFIFGQK